MKGSQVVLQTMLTLFDLAQTSGIDCPCDSEKLGAILPPRRSLLPWMFLIYTGQTRKQLSIGLVNIKDYAIAIDS